MKSAHKHYAIRQSPTRSMSGGNDLRTQDSPVVEQIKPIATKASKGAHRFINGFSFDPHPRRTRIILGAKFAIPSMIAGVLFARMRAKQ